MLPVLKSVPVPTRQSKKLLMALLAKDSEDLRKIQKDHNNDTGWIDLKNGECIDSLPFATLYSSTQVFYQLLTQHHDVNVGESHDLSLFIDGDNWRGIQANIPSIAAFRKDAELLASLIALGHQPETDKTKGFPAVQLVLTGKKARELTEEENQFLVDTVVELCHQFDGNELNIARFLLPPSLGPWQDAPFLHHPKVVALYPQLTRAFETGLPEEVCKESSIATWLQQFATEYLQLQTSKAKTKQRPQ